MLISEKLNAEFMADLHRSGLTVDDVPSWEVMDGKMAQRMGQGHGQNRAGYVIPYYNIDGSPLMCLGATNVPYTRYRFLESGKDGYDSRYWSPDELVDPMRGSHVYIPRSFEKVLRESKQQYLIITEGEKKAEAGCKIGIPTIAIPGVEMWRDPLKRDLIAESIVKMNGGTIEDALFDMKEQNKVPVCRELLAVIQYAASIRRKLVIGVLFDSDGGNISVALQNEIKKGAVKLPKKADIRTWSHPKLRMKKATLNYNVTNAGWSLAESLRSQLCLPIPVQTMFCPVRVVDGAVIKMGLDDWIVADGDVVKYALHGMLSPAQRMLSLIEEHSFFGASADPECLVIDKDVKITPEAIFDDMLDANNVGRLEGLHGEFFLWNESSWSIVPHTVARDAAHIFLKSAFLNKATANTEKSCVEFAASSKSIFRIPDRHAVDTVNSGVRVALLDRTIEIDKDGNIVDVDPNRSHGLLHHVEARWDKRNQQTPLFDKFMDRILPDKDVQAAVIEYIGYTLFPDCRFETAQFWIGKGANGKSKLADIVEALHSNVVALDLTDLRKFRALPIIGASLVSIDETPPRIDEQPLKMMISGSKIGIDRKNKDPITVTPTAKWIIRGNEPPAISDQSDGFWRRQQVVRFGVQIPLEERDEMIAQKIIQNELSGIMYKVILAAAALIKRGKMLPVPHEMAKAKAEIRCETSSVLTWSAENEIHTEINAELFPKTSTVYNAYNGWCKNNGYLPVSASKFWRQVENSLNGVVRKRERIFGMREYIVNLQSDFRRFPSATSGIDSDDGFENTEAKDTLKDNPFMH